MMRGLIIGMACGLCIAVSGAAMAQSRNVTTFTVKPRSWLDAGPAVKVGSQQNYMYDVQTSTTSVTPGSRSSFNLPDRFSGGRGAFVVDYPAPDFLTSRR